MTVSQALTLLKAAYPERSIKVACDVWSHFHDHNKSREDEVEFCVSVLPGVIDPKCDRYTDCNLERAVNAACKYADCKPCTVADEATSDHEMVLIGPNLS